MKTGKMIVFFFLELVLVGAVVFGIGFCSGRDYEKNNPREEVVK